MIHIAPWEVGLGLLAGAGRILAAAGNALSVRPLPARRRPQRVPATRTSTALCKTRDPQWGVRDLDEVEIAAEGEGLVLERVIEMPVNNLSVVFRKPA